MIKKLFICALPVVAMTACTSEEDVRVPVNDNQEIAFSAVNHVMSRNNIVNNDAKVDFDKNNLMYVTALYNDGTSNSVYFEDQAFKYRETPENAWIGWGGSDYTHFYYPYTGDFQFMAYSTSATHETAVWTHATGNTAFDNLVINFNDNLAGTEDVLYSSTVLTQSAADASGAKSFDFNHALAMLTFKVKLNAAGADIKVNKITVKNVAYSGILTVSNNGGTCTAAWTAPANMQDVVVKNDEAVQLTASEAPIGTPFLVVDQTPGTFIVDYTMTVGTNHYDLTKTVTFAQDPITKWQAGNKYVYTVILSPKEITFTGKVAPWTSKTEDEKITG